MPGNTFIKFKEIEKGESYQKGHHGDDGATRPRENRAARWRLDVIHWEISSSNRSRKGRPHASAAA